MDKKKMAAAMAAVYMYIRTGEEAAAAQQHSLETTQEPAAPAAQTNVWGLSGRQAMMNANTLIAMRAFK